MDQTRLSAQRFGDTAQSYLESPVHARGADLDRLRDLAQTDRPQRVLDVGCGAGHASFAVAPFVEEVIAYDVSAPMLAVVAKEAAARGFVSLKTQQGAAETLPFADGQFDWVVTRLSAHHWSSVSQSLREVRRVLKDTGRLIVIDIVAPERALFDTVLQSVEILRDASHVRNYRLSEWARFFEGAGFELTESQTWKIPLVFATWIARMRTPELRAQAVRSVFLEAATEVQEHFAVQEDGSFEIEAAWMEAKPC